MASIISVFPICIIALFGAQECFGLNFLSSKWTASVGEMAIHSDAWEEGMSLDMVFAAARSGPIRAPLVMGRVRCRSSCAPCVRYWWVSSVFVFVCGMLACGVTMFGFRLVSLVMLKIFSEPRDS